MLYICMGIGGELIPFTPIDNSRKSAQGLLPLLANSFDISCSWPVAMGVGTTCLREHCLTSFETILLHLRFSGFFTAKTH